MKHCTCIFQAKAISDYHHTYLELFAIHNHNQIVHQKHFHEFLREVIWCENKVITWSAESWTVIRFLFHTTSLTLHHQFTPPYPQAWPSVEANGLIRYISSSLIRKAVLFTSWLLTRVDCFPVRPEVNPSGRKNVTIQLLFSSSGGVFSTWKLRTVSWFFLSVGFKLWVYFLAVHVDL